MSSLEALELVKGMVDGQKAVGFPSPFVVTLPRKFENDEELARKVCAIDGVGAVRYGDNLSITAAGSKT